MNPSVVIYAKNVEALALFYASVLGLDEVSRSDGYVSLQGPSYAITIVRIRPGLAAQIAISIPPERRENVALKLVAPVRSLNHARTTAAEFGGAIGPVERQWEFEGSIRCDGYDPEGNVIQFAQPIVQAPA